MFDVFILHSSFFHSPVGRVTPLRAALPFALCALRSAFQLSSFQRFSFQVFP
jgi:hypothetical protein